MRCHKCVVIVMYVYIVVVVVPGSGNGKQISSCYYMLECDMSLEIGI